MESHISRRVSPAAQIGAQSGLFVCSQRFRCKPCVILRGCQANGMQALQCGILSSGILLHYSLPE